MSQSTRLLGGLVVTLILFHLFYVHWHGEGTNRNFVFNNYVLIIILIYFQFLPLSVFTTLMPWDIILFLGDFIGFSRLCTLLPLPKETSGIR